MVTYMLQKTYSVSNKANLNVQMRDKNRTITVLKLD